LLLGYMYCLRFRLRAVALWFPGDDYLKLLRVSLFR
jgi:hypothetical protein